MGHLRLGYENHWQQKDIIISTLKDRANLHDATLKNGGKYRVFSLLKDTSTFQTGLFPLQQAVQPVSMGKDDLKDTSRKHRERTVNPFLPVEWLNCPLKLEVFITDYLCQVN